MTHRLDMIKSSVKFHVDIPYGLGVMARTQFSARLYARIHRRTGVELWPGKQISQSLFVFFVFFLFFFFFCFFFFFTVLSRIFHISSRPFIKDGRKPENPGKKKHLTIRKQNLAFPHVTRARLEPQR